MPQLTPTRRSGVLFAVRLALGALWIYEGLWLKVVVQDPHELRIVTSALHGPGISGHLGLILIGAGETLLGVAVLCGLWVRLLAWVQGILLLSMNLLGIFLGGGEIRDPVYLLVHNLPTFACIVVLATAEKG